MTSEAGAFKRRHIAFLLFVALVSLLHVQRAVQVASKQPTDVLIWYDASGLAASNGDPYADVQGERYPYIYPPLFLCLFEPLTWLSYPKAVAAWSLISTAAWIGTVLLGFRMAWPERDVPTWALVFVILLPYRWVLNMILHGQVDLVVCLSLVVSCWLARRGRDVAAGFALALAVVIKLLPVVFFGYYALRARWRVVVAGAGFFVLLFFAPAIRYGDARFQELLGQWRRGPLATEIGKPSSDAQESNQGLAATIYRYGLPEPLKPPEDQAPALVRLSVRQVVAIYTVLAGLVVLVWAATLFLSRNDQRADLLAFALTFIVLHLVSRRSWGYHYVTMAFVYAVLLAAICRSAWPVALKTPLRFAVISTAVLQNFYSPAIVGKRLSAIISSYGPTTLSFVILVATIATVIFRLRKFRGTVVSRNTSDA